MIEKDHSRSGAGETPRAPLGIMSREVGNSTLKTAKATCLPHGPTPRRSGHLASKVKFQ